MKKSNDTLLISEILGKVILPYTEEEVQQILDNQNDNLDEVNIYKNADDVIDKVFVRELSDYKIAFTSRYRETMKLAREREHFSMADSVLLATEMMKNKYLNPAVISACKNLNELDTYLDCLDKNELDDFKIFKIRYELHPILVKNSKKKLGNHFSEAASMTLFDRIRRWRFLFKSRTEF